MGAESRWQRIEEAVESASLQGTVGVAIVGPDGEGWQHHGERKFMAASTAKIPVMIEIFRQIDRGERSLDDRYETEEADKSPGSGVLTHMRSGVHLSLYDLLYLMISISDNMATNILIDMAGMDRINATMQALGMTGSVLGRKMRGRRAIAGEAENIAVPADYDRLIGAIATGTAASAPACAAMTDLLRGQQNERRLARFLPKGSDWGSKTGTVEGVVNDAGFLRTAKGTAVLSMFTEGFERMVDAEAVLGDLAQAAFRLAGVLD